MNVNILGKFFEHNLWSNLQIVQACQGLSDEQLDAEPAVARHDRLRAVAHGPARLRALGELEDFHCAGGQAR